MAAICLLLGRRRMRAQALPPAPGRLLTPLLAFRRAKGSDLRVHFKNTREAAYALRGKELNKAKRYLEDVLAHKRSVPFLRYQGGVGRNSQAKNEGHPCGQGRWPVKSAEFLLNLLKNAESNAEVRAGAGRAVLCRADRPAAAAADGPHAGSPGPTGVPWGLIRACGARLGPQGAGKLTFRVDDCRRSRVWTPRTCTSPTSRSTGPCASAAAPTARTAALTRTCPRPATSSCACPRRRAP